MRYYDITHTLNGEVPIWPGIPSFLWNRFKPSGVAPTLTFINFPWGFTLALTWTPHTIFFPMESGSEKWICPTSSETVSCWTVPAPMEL